MKTCILTTTLALAATLCASADLPMAVPLAGKLTPTPPADAVLPAQAEPPHRPVEAEAPAPGSEQARQEPLLSEAEQRIRVGIVMLSRLHDLLTKIKDEPTAEAAVAPIMRSCAEFQVWAQGFSSLPPLDAETQRSYENRYLSIIDELNTRIRIQGERIASAEFYGSRDLPAALVRLVTSMQ